MHAPPKLAFFEYFDTRSGEAAKEVLKGFRGAVQTDAYAGYNPLLLPDAVERIACMAHMRRKFREAHAFAPAECDRIIRQIAAIYALEGKWRNLSAEERHAKRQELARAELEKFFSLLEELQSRLLPRHGLQEALAYALKQRNEMFRYLDDGRFHLDNNAIERHIRPIARGRKNYLFAGSHDGAKRAAIFYSLLATCRLNKVNPTAWLSHVLKTMPALPRSRYSELLPHRWVPPAAEHSGFNFFAGEPIGADDKDARLFLARYLKKAPLALERLSIDESGTEPIVRYVRPTDDDDDKDEMMRNFSPLEFLAELST